MNVIYMVGKGLGFNGTVQFNQFLWKKQIAITI